MKGVIALFAVLAFTIPVPGQITASLTRIPEGFDQVTIRNDSKTSMVAYAVSVKRAPRAGTTNSARSVVYSDQLVEPSARPLAAGESRMVLSSDMLCCGPLARRDSKGRQLFSKGPDTDPRLYVEGSVVAAGIFEDGMTAGDEFLLARLITRRCNLLLAVETSLDILLDAGRRNVPREDLIRQFQKMEHSMRYWYVPPEQKVASIIYGSIVGKLTNLPPVPLGAPFPPTSFVEEETALLNRQRVALSQSQPSLAAGSLFSQSGR